jgi:hypothetical protein
MRNALAERVQTVAKLLHVLVFVLSPVFVVSTPNVPDFGTRASQRRSASRRRELRLVT